ncbi:MAG: hypothetical protein GXO73_12265, partial [Calditrichaeota bacterium]|nr:hypothetical protein [Calditrichota bacterium]
MRNGKIAKRSWLGWTAALLALLVGLAYAAVDRDVALVLKSKGDAKVRKAITKKWEQAKRGKRLDSGDLVRTGEDGLVALVFTDDKSMLKVRANSDVTIRAKREKKSVSKRIFMEVGQLWAKVTKGQTDFRVETPSGVAAVKGTEFYGMVDRDGTFTVIGIQGLVELFNRYGSVMVGPGKTGRVRRGE